MCLNLFKCLPEQQNCKILRSVLGSCMTLAAFVISLQLVPFFEHSKLTVDSLSHFISVSQQCVSSLFKILHVMCKNHMQSRFRTWAPYRVKCPCLKCHFSHPRHWHPVQNGEIFFVSNQWVYFDRQFSDIFNF